jgi:hypothetical protein
MDTDLLDFPKAITKFMNSCRDIPVGTLSRLGAKASNFGGTGYRASPGGWSRNNRNRQVDIGVSKITPVIRAATEATSRNPWAGDPSIQTKRLVIRKAPKEIKKSRVHGAA